MWLIFSVWLCIASAFLMPPAFTMGLCFSLALGRILFLTHVSLIEVGSEAIGETRKIASDVRRNGLGVIKTVLGWGTAVAALMTAIVVFQIPF
jgi:hypothetical protein